MGGVGTAAPAGAAAVALDAATACQSSPSAATIAIVRPTGILWPGSATSLAIVPESQISTSIAPFCVSTTHTTWPRSTRSPACSSA